MYGPKLIGLPDPIPRDNTCILLYLPVGERMEAIRSHEMWMQSEPVRMGTPLSLFLFSEECPHTSEGTR